MAFWITETCIFKNSFQSGVFVFVCGQGKRRSSNAKSKVWAFFAVTLCATLLFTWNEFLQKLSRGYEFWLWLCVLLWMHHRDYKWRLYLPMSLVSELQIWSIKINISTISIGSTKCQVWWGGVGLAEKLLCHWLMTCDWQVISQWAVENTMDKPPVWNVIWPRCIKQI